MKQSDVVRVGLLGLGTVGCGVVRLLEGHKDDLEKQTGQHIVITKVLVQDAKKGRGVHLSSEQITDDPAQVLNHPEIDVIVEVMGGIDPAREYILQAIANGKNVVTANKDLMALHGGEILSVAATKQCDVFYEASVAGGIPILRALVEGFSSDRITKMIGIVNGTTNYILTAMEQEGVMFEDALAQAQELGYAEADPTADIDGLDAARKMAILATLGFRIDMPLAGVEAKGIADITQEDVSFAHQLGYRIKLVGIAQRDQGKVEVSVQPVLLPLSHPLSSVDGVYNAVAVYGEAVGETMFYGPGAGGMPTATAVVSDLVTVVKNRRLGVNGRGTVGPYQKRILKSLDEIESKHFLRLHVTDEAGVLAQLTMLFASENISLETVLQLPYGENSAQIILITHRASRRQMDHVQNEIVALEAVQGIQSYYRVEGGREG
ncbi:homoserine dehydrogenase [Marininema halotolerans]|uniref:Homoserine dehydrogenase n=1 Tax=Marininema halotolerans TaxID=1155944 RepID=A0A1I6U4J5_9BACL|nr:homoserine dehydrogenase [Marininema halotolerans]SFS96298.1 homoserine dehydrogenase [Marininema halotolerans]